MHRRFFAVAALALTACSEGAVVSTTDSYAIVDSVDVSTGEPIEEHAAPTPPSTTHTSVPGSPPVDAAGVQLNSPEDCSIASRTLATGIEAHYAQYGYDIGSADELVTTGLLIELDAAFVVDFAADSPTPVPVAGGACDYDFDAELDVLQADERSEWQDRECWLDQIAVEVAVRGYIAQVGVAPNSFADIADVYVDFPDGWTTVALGPDGEVVDLVDGGCSVVDNLDVFGEMWIEASPQCAVDAWTIGWALYLTDRFEDPSVSVEQLVAEGLIEERDYLYRTGPDGISDIEGSGCPSMDSDEDVDPDESRACEIELRTIETAAEAFYAMFLRLPESVGELEREGFVRDVASAWVIEATGEAGGVDIRPVSGSRCDLPE